MATLIQLEITVGRFLGGQQHGRVVFRVSLGEQPFGREFADHRLLAGMALDLILAKYVGYIADGIAAVSPAFCFSSSRQ